MYASELIKRLEELIKENGDQRCVNGLDRTGYGEPVLKVEVVDGNNLMDIDGVSMMAFDLVLSDTSCCAVGGF